LSIFVVHTKALFNELGVHALTEYILASQCCLACKLALTESLWVWEVHDLPDSN